MTPPSCGFDTLAHLDDPALAPRLPEIADAARAAGVHGWIVAAGDPNGWERVLDAANRSGGLAALALHPWWAAACSETEVERWMAELDRRDPPIVGELGLDALHAKTDEARRAQRRALRAQLAWARDRDRPILIHAVRAVPEVLDLIRRDGLPRRGGAIHGWTGPPDLALRATQVGLHLSFGPTALAPSARKARASLRAVAPERVLVETGSPCSLAPHGPSDLPSVAAKLAAVLEVKGDALLSATGAAARALFLQ